MHSRNMPPGERRGRPRMQYVDNVHQDVDKGILGRKHIYKSLSDVQSS